MGQATVIILHPPPESEGPLTALLHEARSRLAEHQAAIFRRAGATEVRIDTAVRGASFGERLARLAGGTEGGLVILGAGAVARLGLPDARRLVAAAAGGGRRALTNNRYSSDVCAVSDAAALRSVPPLDGDNALPRWLVGSAGFTVDELPGRARLALDLDGALDIALVALLPRPAAGLGRFAAEHDLAVPRLAELRAMAANPHGELLVFGRASAATLAWLERHTACRFRFLSEERGLRTAPATQRPARATLGRLLALRGPEALAEIVGDLADAAVVDLRVLLADRFGRDEAAWPNPEDRYAADLLRPATITDEWLRALTRAAAESAVPILFGGHTLVGPGLPLLLGQTTA